MALQERMVGIAGLGPREQMGAVLRDRHALDRHAQYVNDMLGDYATYTAKERRILGRTIMFYGFLRFSLHFTFWTMPTKHPVILSLLGNLGRIQTQEVRELLGGDELPFALGRIYTTKDGQLRSADLARANPALNTVTEATNLGKLMSLLPPMVGTAFDLAYGKSSYKGRSLRVRGETGYAATQRESTGERISVGDSARIALGSGLRLAYPYRAAEQLTQKGVPQGDDSLLGSPRPTRYKNPEIRKTLAQDQARQQAEGAWSKVAHQLAPYLPRPSRDPEIAASIRERRGAAHGKNSVGGGPHPGESADEILKRIKSKQDVGSQSAEEILKRLKSR